MREIAAAAAIVVVLAVGLVFVGGSSEPQAAPIPRVWMDQPAPAIAEPPPPRVHFPPGPQGVDTVVAQLAPSDGSTVKGTARGEQKPKGRWTVTVEVVGGAPNASYSLLVVRTGGDPGTPGPTPCTFTTDAAGAGGCTGEMDAETLVNANVMGQGEGAGLAHGLFTAA